MKISLICTDKPVVEAWQQVFAGVEEIDIRHGDILSESHDALVSPANSFGFMNGGLDFAISKTLGWHVEKRLQKEIRWRFYGELLVGQATIVPTDHQRFPWLIAAPTMRTPMTIHRTPNVYLAMRAVLILLYHGVLPDGRPLRKQFHKVALPAFGAGVGQVPPLVCARQMRIAYEDIVGAKYSSMDDWEAMRSNYAYLYTWHDEYLNYDIP